MPSRDTLAMYAMYVIGEVESNWAWTSVSRVDPITIGMMQYYGQRAAGLLKLFKSETPTDWQYLTDHAPNLVSDYDDKGVDEWWNHRFVTDSERAALKHILSHDANHVIQQDKWKSSAISYMNTINRYGVPDSNPKQLIFAMCMYHQRPASCRNVLNTCGGKASLRKMYLTAINERVFDGYKSRYTKAYNRLNAWDGSSEPPDFGQIIDNDDNNVDEGDNNDSPSTKPVTDTDDLTHIIKSGNELILYGKTGAYKDGKLFHATANGWVPATHDNPIVDDDDPDTDSGKDNDPDPAVSDGQKVVNKLLSFTPDRFHYSQKSGRLDPGDSGYTDCSALMYCIYKWVLGKHIGTSTWTQRYKGRKIFAGKPSNLDIGKLQKGDLVFYAWRGWGVVAIGHVEMYIGGNDVCGHGGPNWNDKGPTIKYNNVGRGAPYIMVRRYIADV